MARKNGAVRSPSYNDPERRSTTLRLASSSAAVPPVSAIRFLSVEEPKHTGETIFAGVHVSIRYGGQ